MINRQLIRIKTVQLVYSFYQNGSKTISSTEKELMFSISKAYDMYRYLLLLMVRVYEYGVKDIGVQLSRAERLHLGSKIDRRWEENRFARQLQANKALLTFAEKADETLLDESVVKNLYKSILKSDIYDDYMNLKATTYEDDRTFWRHAYKACFMPDEDIDAMFEEKSLYWNDDRETVDSFVIKTIKRFVEANGEKQPLLPEFDSDDDQEFAESLIHEALTHGDEYRAIISENARGWKLSRMATMDVVLAQLAITEFLNFPTIPAVVTINEYIGLSKVYSTPKSYTYLNGLLDYILKRFRAEGKIMK